MAVTVGMISLGCPKNQVDAEIMLADLKKQGFKIVCDPAQAQVVVINTCGFIEAAKQESIDQILEMGLLKKEGRIKRIIVTGCLAERYREELMQQLPEVDVVLGIGSNRELCEAITQSVQGAEPCCRFGPKQALALEGDRVLTTLPFTAYLKIAEGCDNRCTYCAIPSIRGAFRSRTLESISAEAEALVENGVRELVLVAQDTTRYGLDLYGKPQLAVLLRRLNKIEKLRWIRILYAYPEMVDDELIDAMASLEKVVPYLDIPIQHSNDEVLRRMNRRGGEKMIRELIAHLRCKIPDIVLRTTVITGFPGETEQQFCELCEFLKQARFERLGCFAYSREEGTPAADFPDQIDPQVAQRRADTIMTAQQRVMDAYLEKMQDRVLTVAVEGYDRYAGCYFGRSAYDAPDIDGKIFMASARPLQVGDFVSVKITDSMDCDLLGEVVRDSEGESL